MKRVMACALLLMPLAGCFRMSVRSGAPREGAPEEQTGTSLAYGLTMSNVAAGGCRHGLSRVDVYWPWWGPLVFTVTFGLVAPLRAEYVCAQGPGEARNEAPPDSVPPSHPSL